MRNPTNERDFPVPRVPQVAVNGTKVPRWGVISHLMNRKGKSMAIITVGIDLAKNVFAVHCVDENGKAVLVKPKVPLD